MNVRIDIENFLRTPEVVLYGVVGVFVALGIIYASIVLLSRLFKDKGTGIEKNESE